LGSGWINGQDEFSFEGLRLVEAASLSEPRREEAADIATLSSELRGLILWCYPTNASVLRSHECVSPQSWLGICAWVFASLVLVPGVGMSANVDDVRSVQMDMQGWLVIQDLLWETWSREEVWSPRRKELALILSVIRGELGAPLTPENNSLYNGYRRRREITEQPLTPGIKRRR